LCLTDRHGGSVNHAATEEADSADFAVTLAKDMTSLETLLAAANFVEANTKPDSLAHGSCCQFDPANCSSPLINLSVLVKYDLDLCRHKCVVFIV